MPQTSSLITDEELSSWRAQLPVRFSDLLSKETFTPYLRSELNFFFRTGKESAGAADLFQKQVFTPALATFLTSMRDAGLLKPVRGAENRALWLAERWDSFVAGGKLDWFADTLAAGFLEGDLRRRILVHVAQGKQTAAAAAEDTPDAGKQVLAALAEPSPEVVAEFYDTLVAHVEGGLIPVQFGLEGNECAVTGERFKPQMVGWQLEFYCFPRFQERMPPLAPPPKAYELPFELKGGELLISDWFRIEGFKTAVEPQTFISVNSEAGQKKLTEHYMNTHGFLSVCVGNTCPTVILNDGTLGFGHMGDSEESAGDKLGWVCTDLWWVTAIERSRLEEILGEVHGEKKARKLVEDYLEEHGQHITRVPVEPGTRWVYFSGSNERFTEQFRPAAMPEQVMESPYFVISDKRLDLETAEVLDDAPGLKL